MTVELLHAHSEHVLRHVLDEGARSLVAGGSPTYEQAKNNSTRRDPSADGSTLFLISSRQTYPPASVPLIYLLIIGFLGSC